MVISAACIKLRRSPQAVLIGEVFGFVLLFTAVLLVGFAVAEGSAAYASWSAVLALLWGFELVRGVRICDGSLVVRSLLLKDDLIPLADLTLVEVGRLRENGIPGYVGFVLAVETSEYRKVIDRSRYSGRSRLDQWAETIAEQPTFSGEVRSRGQEMDGNGEPAEDVAS